MIHNVTVYCASSTRLAKIYPDTAAALGRAIALRGWGVIYGGDSAGLMGAVADGAFAAGGKVIGIVPQRLLENMVKHERCNELIIARDMRHRKEMLEARGDAMIALPGGFGTLEEFFEIVVGRHLGYHSKPIVLLNIAGYYNPLLDMIDHGVEHHFIKPVCRDAYYVTESVDDAVDYLGKHESK